MDTIEKYFLLILSVCLFSCTSQETVNIPEHIQDIENLTVYSIPGQDQINTIRFSREAEFGDTDNVFFSMIRDIAIDNNERVYLSDPAANTIHIFDSNASYITSIGREGSGPGEYQSIINVKTHSDRLFVQDRSLLKIDIYEKDSFSLITTIDLNPDRWNRVENLDGTFPDNFYFHDNSSLLIRFRDPITLDNFNSRSIRYYLIDHSGELQGSDTALFIQDAADQIPDMSPIGRRIGSFMQSPATGKPLAAVRDDGTIISAWSDDFLIQLYDSNGHHLRAFYYPFEKSVLDVNELINRYSDPFRSLMEEEDHPDTWPAIEYILVDDENRIWVSTIVDNQEIHEWWVTDEYGELLGMFTWPRNTPVHLIRNGFLYSRETDESGVTKIVKYRIEI